MNNDYKTRSNKDKAPNKIYKSGGKTIYFEGGLPIGKFVISSILHAISFLGVVLVILGAALIAYPMFKYALVWTTRIHWSLGLFMALTLLFFSSYMLAGSRVWLESKDKELWIAIPGWFTYFLICLVVTFAWGSWVMHTNKVALYTIRQNPDFDIFIKFYFWELLDLLPIIDVWKTLPIDRPAKPAGLVAGCLLLVFQIVAIFTLLEAIRRWWKQRPSSDLSDHSEHTSNEQKQKSID